MIELVCRIFEKRKTKKRQKCKQFNKITVWKNWERFSKKFTKKFSERQIFISRISAPKVQASLSPSTEHFWPSLVSIWKIQQFFSLCVGGQLYRHGHCICGIIKIFSQQPSKMLGVHGFIPLQFNITIFVLSYILHMQSSRNAWWVKRTHQCCSRNGNLCSDGRDAWSCFSKRSTWPGFVWLDRWVLFSSRKEKMFRWKWYMAIRLHKVSS